VQVLKTAQARARGLRTALERRLLKLANRERFERDFLRVLPQPFVAAARWAYFEDWTSEERALAHEVEDFRSRIAEVAGQASLESLPSPHSGTFALDDQGRSRGATPTASPVESHARTGVGPSGGILLRRLVTGLGARRILELGTNTGFSGCYFVSAGTQPHLTSVEGSGALCAIARKNIGRFSTRFEVMHCLFDEAIDTLQGKGEHFDCVFIDGQHERAATLHYAARSQPLLRPGAALVFDDVYWSDDMNQAWKDVCRSPEYVTTVDFGWKGVAILADPASQERKQHFDLCEFMGRPRIARPSW